MRRVIALLLVAAAMTVPFAADAQRLVTDISREIVELRYDFAGADLLLFGAVDPPEEGAGQLDIVVTVKGPPEAITVRRKERVAGLWVNNAALTFSGAPGFYTLAATRPLADIADADVLGAHQIGLQALDLPAATPASPETYLVFRQALIAQMAQEGLYSPGEQPVGLVDDRLFRTDVKLPSNVPVGVFTAEAHLFVDGALKASRAMAIRVDKTGFERAVYALAQERPLLYGLTAVAIALLAGWAASFISRR